MHFYESTIMLTTDGSLFRSYSNEHPDGFIIAKPKYIPVTLATCDEFPSRMFLGRHVNRYHSWINKENLQRFIEELKRKCPYYFHESVFHNNWFFGVPLDRIVSAPSASKGAKELLKMPSDLLDGHLISAISLINMILDAGVNLSDIGVTDTTLLGNYTVGKSDIDVVIKGKKNFCDVVEHIRNSNKLSWKSDKQLKDYYANFNSSFGLSEKEFMWHSKRKFVDGYIGEYPFSLFGVENEEEIETRWGEEKYIPLGVVTIKTKVVDSSNAIVRPGYYEVVDTLVIKGNSEGNKVSRIVTYARDFLFQAFPNETVEACGLLEKVEPINGKTYYRLVIGYFDSYLSRRDNEFLKVKNVG